MVQKRQQKDGPVEEGQQLKGNTVKSTSPPPKKRGRPAKAAIPPETLATDDSGADLPPLKKTREEVATSPPPKKKRGRPAKAAIPPETLAADDSGADLPLKKLGKELEATTSIPKKQGIVAPHEPLPLCKGRNTHPGQQKGVAAVPRRKPSEIAAVRTQLARVEEEALKKKEAARQTLAEWDVAEEMEEEEMDAESTQCLSAALRNGYQKRQPESGSNSEGEPFDFDAINIDDSDAEPESELEAPVKKTKVRFQAHKNSAVTNQVDA